MLNTLVLDFRYVAPFRNGEATQTPLGGGSKIEAKFRTFSPTVKITREYFQLEIESDLTYHGGGGLLGGVGDESSTIRIKKGRK